MKTEDFNPFDYLIGEDIVIFISDIESLTIVEANESASEFYGYPYEKIIGMNVGEIYPDAPKKYADIISQIQDSERNMQFCRHRLADGSFRDVQAYMLKINYKGKPSVFSIISDITGYNHIQEEIKNKEAIESVLLKNLPIVFYTTPVNFERDVIWISESIERVTGYTVQEFMSETHFWMDRIHPDDRNEVMKAFESTDDSYNVSFEYRWKVKNGDYRWFFDATNFDRNSPDGTFSGFFIDISSNKFNIEKRYETEERFRKFFRYTESGKVMCDLDGRFVEINPAFCNILGYSEDELKQMKFMDVTHPDDLERSLELIRALKKGEIDHGIQEKKYIRKDKHLVHALLHLSVVKDINRQPEYFIAQIQDLTDRKNLETLLAESENLYRTVVDSANDAIVLQERTGKIIMWNKGAEEIFGLSADDAIGMNAKKTNWDVVKEDGSDFPMDEHPSMVTFRTGKACNGVVMGVMNNSNKTFKWTSINTTPLFKPHEKLPYAAIITISDITERKRMMDEVKHSEERYRALIENAVEAVFVVQNGAVVFANDMCSELSGYSRDEIIGSTIYEYLIEANDDIIKHERYELLSGKVTKISRVQKIRVKDNAVKFCRLNSVRIIYNGVPSVLSFLSDITEKIRMDEILNSRLRLLEESEKHSLDEFLEITLNEAERLTDSSIGFFHFVNENDNTLSLQQWSTNTKQTMCRAVPHEKHYPIDNAGVWADCIRINKPVIHNDFPNLKGKKGYPEGHAEVLRELTVPVARGGKPVAIIGVGNKTTDYTDDDVSSVQQIADLAWDIVQKKISEENLKISEKNLRKSNDEKDKLFSIIAHDLRSPFMAFMGMTEMIAENVGGMKLPDIKDYLLRMNSEAENLFGLINNLLDWSVSRRGLGGSMPGIHALSSIVDETLKAFVENFSKKEIKLVKNIGVNITVYADKQMLQTVFRNLISNAVKFNRRGGEITINAESNNNGRTEILVEDKGIGMDEHILKNLFDISVNTKRKGTEGEPSTGLGLQLCKEFIEKNGGSLHIESETEKGTKIIISLPSGNHI